MVINMEHIEKANSFTPTQAMKNNAERGLALREKYNRGGLSGQQANAEGVGSGVARARDIINGNLSLESVKRMNAFFSRHEKNYNPSKKMPDGGPTAGTIAWLLWGGSAGRAWARSILRKLESVEKSSVPVVKSTNEKLKQATFIVMTPDEIDLHGDIVAEEEIRKACHNFNRHCMKANLFHLAQTDTFEFVESYILPADIMLDEKLVVKGTWVATIQSKNDDLWDAIESGEINGLSIGALATVEKLEEDE